MIIQELAAYFESLSEQGRVGAEGWSKAKVSYGLQLDEDGGLVGIMPLLVIPDGGKKEVPKELFVPEQVKRSSGISPNFLCDNSSYMLGFDDKGKSDKDKIKSKKRAVECFRAAGLLHHEILDCVDDRDAKSLLRFFDTWNPEKASGNEILEEYKEGILKGGNLIFVNSELEYIHKNPNIRQAWDDYRAQKDDDAVYGTCLVTGRKTTIARLHPNIKGIFGAQSSGASLVSYNSTSLESYGHDNADNTGQGFNGPVSESVAFKYGVALNYLVNDREHSKRISDTTIVYWAEDAETGYQDVWGDGFFGDGNITSVKLNTIAEDIRKGKAVSFNDALLYGDTKFYVMGIVPNAARLSVSFFAEGSFGYMLSGLVRFYDELSIVRPKYAEDQTINIWSLLNEVANKNSREKKIPAPIVSSVFRAVLEGIAYPEGLFDNVMLRIRAERDINWRKAAVIKAYLIRRNIVENKEGASEVLTVELNERSENMPYVLGRIFAVLEKIQQEANPGIKSTIRDRYFNSAGSTPATVFPILFKLSQHHVKKLPDGSKIYYDKMIGELQNKIHVAYPARLSLQEQGVFYLGYYHQRQTFFKSKNKDEEE
ncbi:MAG: type I-C CRISPR-associated protein Cas8c/Csd1 [Lachnospiraceae bacterium]|nr:type I-C CRISPR-associated protein Cas8c/Csd1 [Lachnospiraceae bacterium]